jgi:type IV pilus assembly protein PilC
MNNKLSKKDLSICFKQIFLMLDAGIPVSECIKIFAQQNYNNKKLKDNFSKINNDILVGITLAEAFNRRKIFSPLVINMIQAGEISGNLNSVMNELANYYEQEYKLFSNFSHAMIYPLIVFFMMISVLIMALTFVIPSYAQMFENTKLPTITRIVIAISFIIKNYYLILILVFLAFIFLLCIFLKSKSGKIFAGKCFLKSKTYLAYINFIFSCVSYILLKSNINLINDIEIIKNVIGNKFLENDFDVIKEKIMQGYNLSDSVKQSKRFSDILIVMIKIGEDTGNLSNTMLQSEKYFKEELTEKLIELEKLIEPVITIITGIILGIIMIAILEPTLTIGDII